MSQGSPMLTFPALQTWLGKELEVRGIDAVIYTRYILSILQQDHFEVETDPDREMFTASHHHHRKEVRVKGKRQPGKRRRSSWTAEDLKKHAVLECLQSVTGEVGCLESIHYCKTRNFCGFKIWWIGSFGQFCVMKILWILRPACTRNGQIKIFAACKFCE